MFRGNYLQDSRGGDLPPGFKGGEITPITPLISATAFSILFFPSDYPSPLPPLPLSLILIHALIFFPLFTNLLFMLTPFLLLSFYLLQSLFPLPIPYLLLPYTSLYPFLYSFYPILPSTYSSTPSTLYFPLPIPLLLLPYTSLYPFPTSFYPLPSTYSKPPFCPPPP